MLIYWTGNLTYLKKINYSKGVNDLNKYLKNIVGIFCKLFSPGINNKKIRFKKQNYDRPSFQIK